MASKMKKARVLQKLVLDEVEYRPNQVIEADADLINGLEKAGSVNARRAEVAYCLEHEGAEVIEHKAPEPETPQEGGGNDGEVGDEGGQGEAPAGGE